MAGLAACRLKIRLEERKMHCDHGKQVWYIKGGNTRPSNRVGQNCIPCILRNLREVTNA